MRSLGTFAQTADNTDDEGLNLSRNIPNRYVQEELLGDINAAGFADLFDFFYLPMDHETRANFGYCFINLVSPQQAYNFFKAFDGKPLRRFTSNKIVAIVPAAIQGFEANLKHYSRKAVCTDVEIQFRPLFWLHGAAVEFVRKNSGESRVVASGGCGSTRHGNTNHIAFVMAGESSSEETRAGDDSDWKASYKKEKGPPAFRPTGVISPTSSLPNDDHSPVVHHRHRRTKSDGFTEDPRAERARVDEGSSCGHQTGSETILPYVVSAEVSSMPDGIPAYLVSVPISSMSASNLDAPMTLDSPVPNHASFLPEALYQARDDECCCGGCGTAGVGFEAPPEVPDITTVVMRNVPVRYTPSTLMQEIIEYGFGGEFDFFYLPFDHKRNCNHGYCFINLSDFSVMERFAAAFDGFEENLRHYLGNEAFRNLDEE
ncbi:hypothetical protein Pmar_PMAR014676 [Perkinsus marinus ATCC 50983]|uniref:Mei2-like C-terminal RNA recognition motif domain-containing protein n=1 Tax=Perkinsus marinus (strain ATCC 50983 / TXsc) TaxID=423536 RepID=C5LIQ4_PERM5|nr:hypothetical protein Pmar_PMAR014676 [Perkinsus marinus ATCC 50983]EER03457.1 hypothetical protein Pmar_PMAR014676 [Perkinsus marinus ATCC 50983]|eukprot:XP_002771641.1 hypothetical protein Pmar_PMAR014676 [Perkinsus marinus ATCC 50983]